MSSPTPSILFTTKWKGLPSVRRCVTRASSPGCRPARPSTNSKTTSASEMAAIDWLAIAASIPSSSPEMPPVSMTIKAVSSSRPCPYCRSRVRPDKSATKASRLRVSWLKRVDLPTLGRPTKASTGSMTSVSRFDVVGFQGTVVGVDKQPVAPRDHVGSRAL